MNQIIKPEAAIVTHGVEARAFNVIASDSGRILNQKITAVRQYKEGGKNYNIAVTLRFDDECKNGHETFSITADIRENRREYMGGCCHDEIVTHFPEFAHLIKWHLVSTDGPLYYLANTIYHASNRDCNGLIKGERRQIKNGKTGMPCWILDTGNAPTSVDSETCPAAPLAKYVPWMIEGEGKPRELGHARSSAVWPDASDDILCSDRETLGAALQARLPALLEAFKADMVATGFVWPTAKEGEIES